MHKVLGSIFNIRKQTYFLASNILGWNSSPGCCLFWREGLPRWSILALNFSCFCFRLQNTHSPDSSTNTHPYTHTYTLIPTHTPIHTCTYLHTYLHIHTCTHTHEIKPKALFIPDEFSTTELYPQPFLRRVFAVLKSPFFLWGHPTMPY